jgi:hypothetical protein
MRLSLLLSLVRTFSTDCYIVRPDRYIAARRFDSDLAELPILLRHAIGADEGN